MMHAAEQATQLAFSTQFWNGSVWINNVTCFFNIFAEGSLGLYYIQMGIICIRLQSRAAYLTLLQRMWS